MPKRIINIRLRPDQEERIHAIVERSAVLDTSKFMRIAVDWLLMSDLGEVLKKIVDAEKFPDYALPEKRTVRKKRRPKKPRRLNSLVGIFRTTRQGARDSNASVLPAPVGQAVAFSEITLPAKAIVWKWCALKFHNATPTVFFH